MEKMENKAVRPDGLMCVNDLYGAAYLVALSHRLMDVQPSGNGWFRFYFDDCEETEKAYSDFLNDEAIGVQAYISGLTRLKKLMKHRRSA